MKNFLLIFSIAISLHVSAQKIELRFAKENYKADGMFGSYLRYDGKNHYISFTKYRPLGHTKNFVTKFNDDFEEIKTVELEGEKNSYFGEFISLKNKTAVCLMNVTDHKRVISYNLLQMKDDLSLGKQVEMLTLEVKKNNFPSFNFRISQDSSYVLGVISGTMRESEKAATAFTVLDKELNVLWQKEYEFAAIGKSVSWQDASISPQGDVYILIKEYVDSKKKEVVKKDGEKIANYKHKIYKFRKRALKPEILSIDLEGALVRQASLIFSKNNEAYCIGFWTKDNIKILEGIFQIKFNASGEVVRSTKSSFSGKDLSELSEGTDNVKETRDGLGMDASNIVFDNVVLHADGSITANAEENYSRYVSIDNKGSGYTVYYSNDIINFKIDENGKLAVVKVIPKKQSFPLAYYTSYGRFDFKGITYFLYNEKEANMLKNVEDQNKVKTNSSVKRSVAAISSFDAEGRLSRKILFEREGDMKSVLIPGSVRKIGTNKIFIAAENPSHSRSLRFGVLTIK